MLLQIRGLCGTQKFKFHTVNRDWQRHEAGAELGSAIPSRSKADVRAAPELACSPHT